MIKALNFALTYAPMHKVCACYVRTAFFWSIHLDSGMVVTGTLHIAHQLCNTKANYTQQYFIQKFSSLTSEPMEKERLLYLQLVEVY